MVVNFRARGISRDPHNLTRTPTLNLKKKSIKNSRGLKADNTGYTAIGLEIRISFDKEIVNISIRRGVASDKKEVLA
jgi:hypothetical protein